MKELFVVTSELSCTELLRSMALRGKNSFAVRVVPAVELAETALIRCGKVPVGKRVRLEEQQFVIYALMQRVDYFTRAFSFQDAVRLTDTLNAVRMRFAAEESNGLHRALPLGEFADKNAAFLEIYDLYMSWLSDNGRLDDVGLIRYAVENAAEMDAEFAVLDCFDLSPLETALVNRLSGGKCRTVSVQELFGKETSDVLRFDSLTKVYGSVNEVDRVISDICKSGVPMDRCTVAVTDPSVYGQLFYDVAMEKGIPVAFGCGISVSDTRPAGLLSLWDKWNGVGFNGVDALQDMVYSDTFDSVGLRELLNQGRTEEEGKVSLHRLTELAGGMRFMPDARMNGERIDAWEKTLSESSEDLKWVEPLRRLGRELGLPCNEFLKKYASIRRHEFGGRLDKAALSMILEVLELTKRFPGLMTMEQMIPTALELSVGGETADPGKLFLTTVAGALSVQRDQLYILGLSADKFPGKPKENALMLDSDWDLLPCPETAPKSRRLVEKTVNSLITLISLATSLDIGVHVYWPNYDPADLKELIPSSAIYRLLDAFSGVKEEKEGYFPSVYSEVDAIAKAYLKDGRITRPDDGSAETADGGVDPEKEEWAPTAIDTWFGCKRRFLYKYILGLDGGEKDDPMTVISALEFGNLAHLLMEVLAAKHPDEAEFRKMASDLFDDYLTARPPMDREAAEKEKDRFVRMMVSARRNDPGREVVLAEERLHCSHPCGLKLTGRPDRVEADGNGKYIVVDFKTGGTVGQKEDDPQTCRQALIYAWMLQQEGKLPTRCEYRYLRRFRNVPCEVNALTMGQLEEDLTRFYEGLKSGDFAREDGYGKACKENDFKHGCAYYEICKADKKREEARE